MNKERLMLLNAIKQAKSSSEFKSVFNLNVNPKSAKASLEARKKGNALYLQQTRHNAETHKAIFSHYCESIACAPVESQELALAYGNRSYFLLHIQKYEDCVKDIDRALKLTISDVLKAKLLCRKAECLKKLDSSSDATCILETAQDIIDKINDQNKVKLVEMIAALKALTVNNTKKVEMNKRIMNDDKLPLTEDYSSCVSVEYSEKYGRHLVAAKNYKPGDIIFVEKFYTSVADQGSGTFACDYCLKSVWSCIPCDQCNWLMYCSENCKEKAWNSYHDIECSVISHVKVVIPELYLNLSLHLRILITAIKETSNIATLKRNLESLNKDVKTKGLIKSGKFGINNIKNVYCLTSYAPSNALEAMSTFVPLVLIVFVRYSKLKDAFSEIKQFEDLLANEDIMFLGSLLIKIIAISSSNAFGFPCDEFKHRQIDKLDGHMFSDIIRMNNYQALSILYSLLNHSCSPTAEWRYTEQKKMVILAMQPIKKNSQIFINYGYNFEKTIKPDRQEMLSLKYNFVCDCQACVEAWPAIDIPGVVDTNQMEDDVLNDIRKGKYSMQETLEIHELLYKGKFVNKSHLKKLSLSIIHGSQWKQPSLEFFVLLNLFRIALTSMYVPKSLVFGNCD